MRARVHYEPTRVPAHPESPDAPSLRADTPGRARRPDWLPLAVLVWALVVNALATWAVARTIETEAATRLGERATSEQLRIEQRMLLYIALLRGVAARFQSGPIAPADFRAYVARLQLEEIYPGGQGVGFAAYLQRGHLAEFEGSWRAAHPDFRVWPPPSDSFATSIVMLEPLDRRNRAAIGFDMASEPRRRAAMERTIDTGLPRATEKLTLVQEIDRERQAGFLLYVGVYDAVGVPATRDERWRRLRGFAYAPFRADDLIRSIRAGLPGDLALEVYDGATLDEAHLLHRSGSRRGARHVERRAMTFAGQTWTLLFHTSAVSSPAARALAPATGAAGLLVSLLLFWGVRRLASAARTQRALRLSAESERERAERAAELRERVVAIVSHDLRNPLGAIKMAATLLGRRGLADDAARLVQRIGASAERMSRMIEQLLDFARLRQGQALTVDLRPIDLGALARAIVDEQRLAFPDRALDLAARGDLRVVADPDRVAQVLSNLIGNALQHGGGSPVSVRVEGGDRVGVSVHNGGAAIPEEVRARIFEPFARGQETGARSLGLGLYISHEIVRAHGGELTVTSSEREGTTFAFSLRRDPSPAAAAQCGMLPPTP